MPENKDKPKRKKQWNNQHYYYEESNGDGTWREIERPAGGTLTEEKFSAVYFKLATPNYNEVKLIDSAQLGEQVALKVPGAGDKRDEDDFGPLESPIVYYAKRKVSGKEKIIPILRTVNTSRENNLYESFIHKALWNYSKVDVENMMEKFRAEMERGNVWKKHGWSKDVPPPLVKGAKQFNCASFVEHLQKKDAKGKSKKK